MEAIRAKLPAAVRDQTAFLLVSFDVERDTPASLAAYRVHRNIDSSWSLLHGSADSVRELAAVLGVKYKKEADGAFSHSNLITVLNGEGEIVHQRTGLKGGIDEVAAAVSKATQ
jgi:protein SCO1